MCNECLNCGKPVKNKYCSVSCQNVHQCKGKSANPERINKMKETNKQKYKIFEVLCYKCGNKFEISEYNVEKPKKEKYFCSKSCANSRIRDDEYKKKISEINKNSDKVKNANIKYGKIRRGKFLKIKEIKTPCLYCGLDITHKENTTRKYHKECWYKCSGGIKEGSSRGKCGWYKGYRCDSSYELAWVIYNLEHNIKFERNRSGFDYMHEGKKKKYYPDFILEDGSYIEVKNYKSEQTDAKLSYFPHKINILYKWDMKKIILPYVIEKYGKDFIKLYENKGT
jgi:hypothetical protein